LFGATIAYTLVGLVGPAVGFVLTPLYVRALGMAGYGTVAFLFFQLQKQPANFVPTFVMLIGIWMGCWWVGRAQERIGVAGFGQWVQATAIAGGIGLAGGTGIFWSQVQPVPQYPSMGAFLGAGDAGLNACLHAHHRAPVIILFQWRQKVRRWCSSLLSCSPSRPMPRDISDQRSSA
jgi:hypothetical protein